MPRGAGALRVRRSASLETARISRVVSRTPSVQQARSGIFVDALNGTRISAGISQMCEIEICDAGCATTPALIVLWSRKPAPSRPPLVLSAHHARDAFALLPPAALRLGPTNIQATPTAYHGARRDENVTDNAFLGAASDDKDSTRPPLVFRVLGRSFDRA